MFSDDELELIELALTGYIVDIREDATYAELSEVEALLRAIELLLNSEDS